jgi:hypothetical protein
MQLDPSIILNARSTVPLQDMGSVYDNAAKMQQHQETAQLTQQRNEQMRATNEAYRRATRQDGSIDQGILLSTLAQLGQGNAIPGVQKAGIEMQKGQSEVSHKNMETDAKSAELLYRGLKEVDGSIASLMANPNVDDRAVYGEVGRLARVGAFDMQAKHNGVSVDAFAKDLLSTMPVGNPGALKSWLAQAGMRTADASKRLEMALPKYDEQARGGTINQGTINQMTGQRTAGTGPQDNVTMTPTADTTLKANVDMRGQNIVDSRARETNDINREASQSQIVDGPNGPMVVNKATTLARPVATLNGQPLLNKDSAVAKNAQMAATVMPQIERARGLLNHATGSGAGALVDKALAVVGQSTQGADSAAALDTLGGWMTSNVPRFEGPQSNADTEVYKTMAGRVSDRTLPISQRKAALDEVQALMQARAGKPGTAPAGVVVPAPPPAGSGPQLSGRGTVPYTGRTPIGARPGPQQNSQQPDINSFFRN